MYAMRRISHPASVLTLAFASALAVLAACHVGGRRGTPMPSTDASPVADSNERPVSTDARTDRLALVPNLVGLSSEEATRFAQRSGFEVVPLRVPGSPAGVVLTQDLVPGREAPTGSPIGIHVASGRGVAAAPDARAAAAIPVPPSGFTTPPVGPSPEMTTPRPEVVPTPPDDQPFVTPTARGVVVPPVLDRTPEQARRILEDAGLRYREEVATSGVPGRVMDQDPPAGARRPLGAEIVVKIPPAPVEPSAVARSAPSATVADAPAASPTAAPAKIIVPSVLDKTEAVARRILEDLGLRVRGEPTTSGVKGHVMDQLPSPGMAAEPGAVVIIRIPGLAAADPELPATPDASGRGAETALGAPDAAPSASPPPPLEFPAPPAAVAPPSIEPVPLASLPPPPRPEPLPPSSPIPAPSPLPAPPPMVLAPDIPPVPPAPPPAIPPASPPADVGEPSNPLLAEGDTNEPIFASTRRRSPADAPPDVPVDPTAGPPSDDALPPPKPTPAVPAPLAPDVPSVPATPLANEGRAPSDTGSALPKPPAIVPPTVVVAPSSPAVPPAVLTPRDIPPAPVAPPTIASSPAIDPASALPLPRPAAPAVVVPPPLPPAALPPPAVTTMPAVPPAPPAPPPIGPPVEPTPSPIAPAVEPPPPPVVSVPDVPPVPPAPPPVAPPVEPPPPPVVSVPAAPPVPPAPPPVVSVPAAPLVPPVPPAPAVVPDPASALPPPAPASLVPPPIALVPPAPPPAAESIDPSMLAVPKPRTPLDDAYFPFAQRIVVAATWDAVEGATGYLLEVEELAGGVWVAAERRVVKSTRAVVDLEPRESKTQDFRWRVRTVVGRRGGRPTTWAVFHAR